MSTVARRSRRAEPPAAAGLAVLPALETAHPRASRAEELAGQLRDEILRGRLAPGARLPAERELAERHALSRSSVREALQQL